MAACGGGGKSEEELRTEKERNDSIYEAERNLMEEEMAAEQARLDSLANLEMQQDSMVTDSMKTE